MPLFEFFAKASIKDLEQRKDVKGLIRALARYDWFDVSEAARALGRLRDKRALPALTTLLREASDPHCRTSAADGLCGIGDPAAVESLIVALRDPDAAVRSGAARALTVLKDARAIPGLVQVLQHDSDEMARSWAATGLGNIGGAAACDALAQALGDTSHQVAVNAAEAISGVGDVRVIEPLYRFLVGTKDGGLSVDCAEKIAAGIRNLGAPSVKVLVECLRFAGGFYRVDAAWQALIEITGAQIKRESGKEYAAWKLWLDEHRGG